MTTTNNITNQAELSNYLKSKGVHHYTESVFPNGSFVQVDICEVPISLLAQTDGSKFFNALNVCLELIDKGLAVVKSECNRFIFITPKHNIVAENN